MSLGTVCEQLPKLLDSRSAPKEPLMKSARKLSAKVERLSLLFGLVFGLGLFAAKQALATEYYVAPTGSDSNPGTQASPFATLQKGADTAVAGDTVWLRGGRTRPRRPNRVALESSSRRAARRIPTESSTGPMQVRPRFSTSPTCR